MPKTACRSTKPARKETVVPVVSYEQMFMLKDRAEALAEAANDEGEALMMALCNAAQVQGGKSKLLQ